MERLKTSNVSVSNGNLKYPIGKSIFSVNLPLKLFCATVAKYANTESRKSLRTLFDTYLDYIIVHAGEIWTKSYSPKCTKQWNFWTKNRVLLKPLFDKAFTPFCMTFLWLKQLFDGKLLIFRLPIFGVPKNMVIQHVQPGEKLHRTKHGRPDLYETLSQ